MKTRYGVYYPSESGSHYTAYRITTQAGLDEFRALGHSVKGDAMSCFIPKAMFHRLLDLTGWNGVYADVCLLSDDPGDLEESEYREGIVILELGDELDDDDLEEEDSTAGYLEGSEAFFEVWHWYDKIHS